MNTARARPQTHPYPKSVVLVACMTTCIFRVAYYFAVPSFISGLRQLPSPTSQIVSSESGLYLTLILPSHIRVVLSFSVLVYLSAARHLSTKLRQLPGLCKHPVVSFDSAVTTLLASPAHRGQLDGTSAL